MGMRRRGELAGMAATEALRQDDRGRGRQALAAAVVRTRLQARLTSHASQERANKGNTAGCGIDAADATKADDKGGRQRQATNGVETLSLTFVVHLCRACIRPLPWPARATLGQRGCHRTGFEQQQWLSAVLSHPRRLRNGVGRPATCCPLRLPARSGVRALPQTVTYPCFENGERASRPLVRGQDDRAPFRNGERASRPLVRGQDDRAPFRNGERASGPLVRGQDDRAPFRNGERASGPLARGQDDRAPFWNGEWASRWLPVNDLTLKGGLLRKMLRLRASVWYQRLFER